MKGGEKYLSYTAEERECVINFDDSSDEAYVYTASRPIMTKLDKLCKANPEVYKLIKEDENSKTYIIINKNLISFRSPKTISEETREKLKENGKRLGQTRNKNN